jgi:hypothetical protein
MQYTNDSFAGLLQFHPSINKKGLHWLLKILNSIELRFGIRMQQCDNTSPLTLTGMGAGLKESKDLPFWQGQLVTTWPARNFFKV